MNSWINLNALWKIVVIGLLAGAGLPAVFAVGLRALAPGARKAAADGAVEDEIAGAQDAQRAQAVGTDPAAGVPDCSAG